MDGFTIPQIRKAIQSWKLNRLIQKNVSLLMTSWIGERLVNLEVYTTHSWVTGRVNVRTLKYKTEITKQSMFHVHFFKIIMLQCNKNLF